VTVCPRGLPGCWSFVLGRLQRVLDAVAVQSRLGCSWPETVFKGHRIMLQKVTSLLRLVDRMSKSQLTTIVLCDLQKQACLQWQGLAPPGWPINIRWIAVMQHNYTAPIWKVPASLFYP